MYSPDFHDPYALADDGDLGFGEQPQQQQQQQMIVSPPRHRRPMLGPYDVSPDAGQLGSSTHRNSVLASIPGLPAIHVHPGGTLNVNVHFNTANPSVLAPDAGVWRLDQAAANGATTVTRTTTTTADGGGGQYHCDTCIEASNFPTTSTYRCYDEPDHCFYEVRTPHPGLLDGFDRTGDERYRLASGSGSRHLPATDIDRRPAVRFVDWHDANDDFCDDVDYGGDRQIEVVRRRRRPMARRYRSSWRRGT